VLSVSFQFNCVAKKNIKGQIFGNCNQNNDNIKFENKFNENKYLKKSASILGHFLAGE
jgi:hypothetical protein